jgi:hypothetical protein
MRGLSGQMHCHGEATLARFQLVLQSTMHCSLETSQRLKMEMLTDGLTLWNSIMVYITLKIEGNNQQHFGFGAHSACFLVVARREFLLWLLLRTSFRCHNRRPPVPSHNMIFLSFHRYPHIKPGRSHRKTASLLVLCQHSWKELG